MNKTCTWLVALLVALPLFAHAQLKFPSTLTNELDQTQLDASARDVIVLIHGWTGKTTIPAGYNRYLDAGDAPELNSLFNIFRKKLAGTTTRLVTYHWEDDATTGSVLNGLLVVDAAGYGSATEAAVNAKQHGVKLGALFNRLSPDLRRVHFIAHSAGSWAAREATKTLLELDPFVMIQMTLLDPFIPDANFGMTTSLSTAVMSATDELPGSDRIYRLENYYAEDQTATPLCGGVLPTISTQEVFNWRTGRDISQRVNWGTLPQVPCDLHYFSHSGPIEFYADTVKASIKGEPVPGGLFGSAFEFTRIGWYRSLSEESFLLPKITAQPQSLTIASGETVTLSVSADRADSLQWFKDGVLYPATSASLLLTSISTLNAGEYVVRVSNTSGSVVSEKALLTVTSSAAGVGSDVYTFITLAGLAGSSGSADGTGSAARFWTPSGVAVDSAGNVYVADSNNSTIRKVTPMGDVTTLAGLAYFNDNGSLILASGSADGTGSEARFVDPSGVAVDSTGNVYVADSGNNTIRKVTPVGVVTTLAGLAYFDENRRIVSDSTGHVDGTGSAARFNRPSGVTVDNAGNVYVADRGNNTIRKVTPTGDVTTLAGLADTSGSTDGTGSAARFNRPSGVTVDNAGTVYVADMLNNAIRKVTPAGVVTTLAGLADKFGSADGTGSVARFDWPSGVAVDNAGNVYVADNLNNTIRKVTPSGMVKTLAGRLLNMIMREIR